ncbi:hypothetical protein LY76DRAFT_309021 [Colletotrichum caudatum]|nr:hypothetical protein LY76DRAFT_309021 [Colletotrichum caudatum]
MDRYPCVNRFKHGVDCPAWVSVYGARCEDCVIVRKYILHAELHQEVTDGSMTGGVLKNHIIQHQNLAAYHRHLAIFKAFINAFHQRLPAVAALGSRFVFCRNPYAASGHFCRLIRFRRWAKARELIDGTDCKMLLLRDDISELVEEDSNSVGCRPMNPAVLGFCA